MQCINLSLFADNEYDGTNDAANRIDDLTMAERAVEAVPGLFYTRDYVSDTEEQHLLDSIDAAPWSTHWQRRTQHYGRSYLERQGSAQEKTGREDAIELPAWIWSVRDRLVKDNIFGKPANQMGINEYLPGQGIAGHVDYHGGEVVSITLGTGCLMEFHKLDGTGYASTWLAPRSLVALKGEARCLWTHGIPRRKTDVVQGITITRGRRVSATLRCIV